MPYETPTFGVIFFIALVLIVLWPITWRLLVALMLAIMLFTIGQIAQVVSGSDVVAPNPVTSVPADAATDPGPAVPPGVPSKEFGPPG